MRSFCLLFLILGLVLFSCSNNSSNASKNLLTDFTPIDKSGNVNVVVEIPSGTLEKWEVNKNNGQLELEYKDGKPRIVKYLGYPGNYGMVPQTLLPKALGGDGDPLDVIVLGPPVERGKVLPSKLIGVLHLLDRGEQDDKLIAVSNNSPLYHVNTIQELETQYKASLKILEYWFSNYKGPNKMQFKGFGSKQTAEKILQEAIKAYQTK